MPLGPYTLNKAVKLSIFLRKWVFNFYFFKSHPCKVKNENHQNSMFDSSKEPHGFTDCKSEVKIKKY